MSPRGIARAVLAIFYAVAGCFHIATPRTFLAIMPDWVPYPEEVVIWSGVAELIGAIALVQPFSRKLRSAGAIGLTLYAICVFPANINHFALDMARQDNGFGLAYHIPRMIAQPLIVWLTLWSAHLIDWPFRAKRR